jgi:hypothetical protein
MGYIDSKEAESYYHLGRSCVALRSVFDSTELSTVQAVSLISSYHQMAGKRHTLDSTVGGLSVSYQLYT